MPRVLADDLLVLTISDSIDEFVDAFETTHIYLNDVGLLKTPPSIGLEPANRVFFPNAGERVRCLVS